jgi:predicted O-methyltransferase YrrM
MKKLISKFLIQRGFRRWLKVVQEYNKIELDSREAIDLLFSQKAELIRPWQFKEEIAGLAAEIEKLRPKVVVEIGTANGGTLFLASRLADPNALIISIDLPGGKFGGGYPDWKIPIYKAFARKEQVVELIRGDSHAPATFDQVKNLLGGRKVDYLFIDGDHTYEGAKQDFERYSQLVRPGGLIGFHDIVVHKGSDCKVFELWQEVKRSYVHKEFVNDWDQNCYGVGVITYQPA